MVNLGNHLENLATLTHEHLKQVNIIYLGQNPSQSGQTP
jgi:hypothetical protein